MDTMGLTLGQFANDYTRQLQANQQMKMQKQAMDMQQQAMDMQKTRAAQEAEQFGWTRQDQDEKTRVQKAEAALSAKYRPMFAKAAAGDYSFAPDMMTEYNGNQGGLNDGHYAAMQDTPNGPVVHHIDPSGKVIDTQTLTPQSAQDLLTRAYMFERSGIGSPQLREAMQTGLEQRKVGVLERNVGAEETKAGAAAKSVDVQEQYRKDQKAVLDAQAAMMRAQAGYYGRMPGSSGGGGGGGSGVIITPDQQSQLQSLSSQYYATDDPKEQATIARKVAILQNNIAIQNKRFPSLTSLTREPKAALGDFSRLDFTDRKAFNEAVDTAAAGLTAANKGKQVSPEAVRTQALQRTALNYGLDPASIPGAQPLRNPYAPEQGGVAPAPAGLPLQYPNRAQYVNPDAPTALGPKLGLWVDKNFTGGVNQTPAWKQNIQARQNALYGVPQAADGNW